MARLYLSHAAIYLGRVARGFRLRALLARRIDLYLPIYQRRRSGPFMLAESASAQTASKSAPHPTLSPQLAGVVISRPLPGHLTE